MGPRTGLDGTQSWSGGNQSRSGWDPELVWMGPRTGLYGAQNWSGWDPELVWMGPRTGLYGTQSSSGWDPEPVWMGPRARLRVSAKENYRAFTRNRTPICGSLNLWPNHCTDWTFVVQISDGNVIGCVESAQFNQWIVNVSRDFTAYIVRV